MSRFPVSIPPCAIKSGDSSSPKAGDTGCRSCSSRPTHRTQRRPAAWSSSSDRPEMAEILPVHAVLPELLAALQAHDAAVLIAPPGAGKTTIVPPALLEA